MFLNEQTYSKISSYTITSNDVYISIAGTIGVAALVPEQLNGANLTENAAKLHNLKNVKKEYLSYFLNSAIIQNQNKSFIGKNTQPKLALFRIQKLKILVPTLLEQDKIVSYISKVDELIQKTDEVIEQTRRLKKGLMQRLLTKGIRHTEFKRTALGNIPKTWTLTVLNSVCNKIQDGSHALFRRGASFCIFTDKKSAKAGRTELLFCQKQS